MILNYWKVSIIFHSVFITTISGLGTEKNFFPLYSVLSILKPCDIHLVFYSIYSPNLPTSSRVVKITSDQSLPETQPSTNGYLSSGALDFFRIKKRHTNPCHFLVLYRGEFRNETLIFQIISHRTNKILFEFMNFCCNPFGGVEYYSTDRFYILQIIPNRINFASTEVLFYTRFNVGASRVRNFAVLFFAEGTSPQICFLFEKYATAVANNLRCRELITNTLDSTWENVPEPKRYSCSSPACRGLSNVAQKWAKNPLLSLRPENVKHYLMNIIKIAGNITICLGCDPRSTSQSFE